MNSIGDLARTIVLQSRQTQHKAMLNRLTKELSTGQRSDLRQHLNGHTAQIASLDHDMSLSREYLRTTTEADNHLTQQQLASDEVASALADTQSQLNAARNAPSVQTTGALAASASGALERVISSISSSFAGRPLFPGGDMIGSAEDLLDSLSSTLPSPQSPDDRATAINAFFDDPAGPFQSLLSQSDPAIFVLGKNQQTTLGITASHESIVATVKALATVAILARNQAEAPELSQAAFSFSQARSSMIETRAILGIEQQRVASARTTHRARLSAFEQTRNDLTTIDPFETASRLEETRFQLEALYTVSARIGRLSLMNYL